MSGTKGRNNKQTETRVARAFRTILTSLRSYGWLGLIASIATMIEGAMQIAIPTVMADFIDKGIVAHSDQALYRYGLVLIVYAVIALMTGLIAVILVSYSCSGFAKNMRHDMFARLQSLSFSDVDRFASGTLVTRLTSDVSNVQMAYQMVIRTGMRSIVMIIVSWWITFSISPSISFVFLAFAPVVFVVSGLAARLVFPNFSRIFKLYDKMNAMVGENLRNMRVVKSYVRKNYEIKRFSRISSEIYHRYRKTEYVMNYSFPLFNLCFYVGMLLIAWMASRQIVASGNNPALGLTTGALAALITYAIQILVALTNIVVVLVMVVIARTSMHRIAQVMQSRNTAPMASHPLIEVAEPSIRFEHVSLRYPVVDDESANGASAIVENREVLHDINLAIPAGATIGIVGATGSGKSSIVQLIARLYDVSEGSLLVGGSDVREYDPAILRDAIGIVLQKNVLFSGTIAENLRWGDPHASDEQLHEVCKIACADTFINEFADGYDTLLDQGGANLSGGQRQRLCIARALLKHPKILILDDSMSAVDTKTDRHIRQGLRNFMPEATKIIVAQRITSIQDADMIVVLENGCLQAVGTHDALMETCAMYRAMALSQQRDQDSIETANVNDQMGEVRS